MTADKPSQEFHLTRTGWVSGTSRLGDAVQGRVIARPADAVETWIEEMVIFYAHCADVYAWRLAWFDESIPAGERKALRHRFSAPSDDFPG